MAAFARLTAVLAGALRFTADRLDPPPVKPQPSSDDPDGELADRRIGEMQLREALRRYSPREERAQA